jgi:hypothetical protein
MKDERSRVFLLIELSDPNIQEISTDDQSVRMLKLQARQAVQLYNLCGEKGYEDIVFKAGLKHILLQTSAAMGCSLAVAIDLLLDEIKKIMKEKEGGEEG